MKLILYYRISDAGYNKIKPEYVNNETCLRNFISIFGNENLYIFADNTSEKTDEMIEAVYGRSPIKISQGSSGQSFRYIFEKAIGEHNDDDVIYFIENDYIHRKNSKDVLLEGIELGADFVSLYDHPDKYINASKGGNPEIEGGGEYTQVFKTPSCWFKLTNSTTMTIAAKIKTLKEYSYIIRKHTEGTYPTDYNMCVDLRAAGASLISPIPSYSTHGEIAWLSNPSEGNEGVIEKWKKIIEESTKKI